MINIGELRRRIEKQLSSFENDVEEIITNTQMMERLIGRKAELVKERVISLNTTNDVKKIGEIFDLLHDMQYHIDQVNSVLQHELMEENSVSLETLAERFPNEGFFV